jgi:glyoxylate/hydroxypyruvate reductase A
VITEWAPGAPQADYAVVWAPPQQFMDEQPALKGIFNIGAGVDALLKLRLPQGAQVVRLDDAGMSVQMAEFVCHAVIRHFREFDGYEADVARANGLPQAAPRADFPVGIMGLGVLGERVARAVAQFDFPVNGWSRTPRPLTACAASRACQLADFLAATRAGVPVAADARHARHPQPRHLSRLQPGGYVINVARGAIWWMTT